jgi:hypothetical protein
MPAFAHARVGMTWEAVAAGFKKHVIPALMCAVAWDLCFLKPSRS